MVPPKVPAGKLSSWGRRFKVFFKSGAFMFPRTLTMALPVLTSNYTKAILKADRGLVLSAQ